MQHYKTTEKLPGDSAVPGSIVRSHNRFRSRKNCTYLSDRSKRNHPQNFGYGQRAPEYTRILHQRVLHSVSKIICGAQKIFLIPTFIKFSCIHARDFSERTRFSRNAFQTWQNPVWHAWHVGGAEYQYHCHR